MDTLLLGQTFEPLDRVTWRRAMTLWVAGRVEVLHNYEDRAIHTVRRAYPMPSVVRFLRSRRRERGVRIKFSREAVYARDRGCCQYCAQPVTRRTGTYDHVVPRSRGGLKRWENIVLACKPCNQRKGNRTPSEARMLLHAPPRKPTWLPEVWRVDAERDARLPDVWRPYLGLSEAS